MCITIIGIAVCCQKPATLLKSKFSSCSENDFPIEKVIYGASIPYGCFYVVDTAQKTVVFGDTINESSPVGVSWELPDMNLEEIFEKNYLGMADDPLYIIRDSVKNSEYKSISYYSIDLNGEDTLESMTVYIQYDGLIRIKEIAGIKPLKVNDEHYCMIITGLFKNDW